MQLKYGTPQEAGMSARQAEKLDELALRMLKEDVTRSPVILGARNGIIFPQQEVFTQLRWISQYSHRCYSTAARTVMRG